MIVFSSFICVLYSDIKYILVSISILLTELVSGAGGWASNSFVTLSVTNKIFDGSVIDWLFGWAMGGWMDGWTDGVLGMDERMDGWKDGWVDNNTSSSFDVSLIDWLIVWLVDGC